MTAIIALFGIFAIYMIIYSIVSVNRYSSLKEKIYKQLESTEYEISKEIDRAVRDINRNAIDRIEEKCKILDKEISRLHIETSGLMSCMKTSLKGINKNTKMIFDSLIEAVNTNDALKLSQVVRAAKALSDNFDAIEGAFDESLVQCYAEKAASKPKERDDYAAELTADWSDFREWMSAH